MKAELRRLAASQVDVVTRDQLRLLGIGRDRVRTQVRSGRWATLGERLVVLHNGPLTKAQRQWAAVLWAGPGAALAGRTALELAGLIGWEDDNVHVLMTRGRDTTDFGGLAVVRHETRRPVGQALDVIGQPPRTRVERSAIDAASWIGKARPACGLLAAVVQQRLSTASRMLVALEEAGPIRLRGPLRAALRDIEGGAHALSEIDFVRLCRGYGLGTVLHQRIRYDALGKRRYLDAVIKAINGVCIACEVDGAIHLAELSYWHDMSRQNELYIAGEGLLRFPSIAFRLEPWVVADQIRRASEAVAARQRAA